MSSIEHEPIRTIENRGTRYVPLSEAIAQLGGTLAWDSVSRHAVVVANHRMAEVQVADEKVQVDDEEVVLSAPPIVINDALYVPIDFFDNVVGQQIYLA